MLSRNLPHLQGNNPAIPVEKSEAPKNNITVPSAISGIIASIAIALPLLAFL